MLNQVRKFLNSRVIVAILVCPLLKQTHGLPAALLSLGISVGPGAGSKCRGKPCQEANEKLSFNVWFCEGQSLSTKT